MSESIVCSSSERGEAPADLHVLATAAGRLDLNVNLAAEATRYWLVEELQDPDAETLLGRYVSPATRQFIGHRFEVELARAGDVLAYDEERPQLFEALTVSLGTDAEKEAFAQVVTAACAANGQLELARTEFLLRSLAGEPLHSIASANGYRIAEETVKTFIDNARSRLRVFSSARDILPKLQPVFPEQRQSIVPNLREHLPEINRLVGRLLQKSGGSYDLKSLATAMESLEVASHKGTTAADAVNLLAYLVGERVSGKGGLDGTLLFRAYRRNWHKDLAHAAGFFTTNDLRSSSPAQKALH